MNETSGRWLEIYRAVLHAQRAEGDGGKGTGFFSRMEPSTVGWFRDHLLSATEVCEDDLARVEVELVTALENCRAGLWRMEHVEGML